MKKISRLSLFLIFLACPFMYAQTPIPVVDNIAISVLAKSGIDQVIYYAQSVMQMAQNVQNTYDQLKYMAEASVRAYSNLRGIADVKSWDDFMQWNNRQLYLDREVEERFYDMGLKVGNRTYRMEDIDEIPGAFRKNFGDQYWDDFTSDQRREMYLNLGLTPSNYMYLQKWQAREDEIARRIQTYGSIYADEMDRAAQSILETINSYSVPDESIDANKILKDTHITQMKIEMAIREQNRLLAEQMEYNLSKDSPGKAPPNPPRLYNTWNKEFFGKITEGSSEPDI